MALSSGQLLVGKDAFGPKALTKPSQGFSRPDNPNQRFLGLTGVILEADYTLWVLRPEMERIKAEFFQTDPDEPVILHRKESKQALDI